VLRTGKLAVRLVLSMGFKLRRMIRDGAPGDWTALMHDVAKEIADSADPDELPPYFAGRYPRSTVPIEGEFRHGKWRDGLVEICGSTARAVSDALTQLARSGYEMRVPITTNRHGKPVFAAKGHALTFQVPPMAPRSQPRSSHQSAGFEAQSTHSGATFGVDSEHDNATNAPQRSHPGVPKLAPGCDPISSAPSKSSPSVSERGRKAILAAVPDATETEIDSYAAGIEKEHNPGDLGAYIARFPPGQITEAIGRMRATGSVKPTRPSPRQLPDIDPDTTPEEVAEVLAILGERGAREPAAVLRAEIDNGNGYKLLGEARHRLDRGALAKWDDVGVLAALPATDIRPADAPETRTSVPPAETPSLADDGEPLDAAGELAKTKAYLARLNVGNHSAARQWRDPEKIAAEQAAEARAIREAAERAAAVTQ
jgi:hypothetical protein